MRPPTRAPEAADARRGTTELVAIPVHPRLAEHVAARLHRIGMDDRLVLLDTARDRVVVLPAAAWSVLCHADGTRDVEGICLSARRFGAAVQPAAVLELLADLDALAWLDDGPACGLLEGEATPVATDDDRTVLEMVAARYRCDGRGDCCRSYPTISMTPADVHRIGAAMADDDALIHRSHRVFLPTVGSAPTVMRAVALVDGACRFLADDGACAVHRRGGAAAKPVGCAWYPTRLVDDGVEVRAAPAIECVCPARPDPSAAPLLPPTRVDALPLGVTIVRVPLRVRFAAGAEVDRAVAIAATELFASGATDAPRALWTWGTRLAQAGWVGPEATCDDTIEVSQVSSRFAAVAARARARVGVESTWRSDGDVVCRRLRRIATVAGLLAAPSAAALVLDVNGDPALERHVLAVASFARGLLVGDDVGRTARDLALQMWLARALAAFGDLGDDVTLRETPLAAVLATWRAQRLGDR